jgi:hypothetical protein
MKENKTPDEERKEALKKAKKRINDNSNDEKKIAEKKAKKRIK